MCCAAEIVKELWYLLLVICGCSISIYFAEKHWWGFLCWWWQNEAASSCEGPPHHINASPPRLVFVPCSADPPAALGHVEPLPAGAARSPGHLHGDQVPNSCSHHSCLSSLHGSNLTCNVIFFYLFRELCELGPSIKDVLWFVGVLSLVDLFGAHEIDCYKPVVLQRSCVSERQAGSLLTTLLLIPVLTPCLNWNLHLAPTEVSSCSS